MNRSLQKKECEKDYESLIQRSICHFLAQINKFLWLYMPPETMKKQMQENIVKTNGCAKYLSFFLLSVTIAHAPSYLIFNFLCQVSFYDGTCTGNNEKRKRMHKNIAKKNNRCMKFLLFFLSLWGAKLYDIIFQSD